MTYIATKSFNVNYWLMPVVEKQTLTGYDVILATCKAFGIDRYKLMSKSRKRELVRAKYICMYVMRLKIKIGLKKISLQQIGAEFNRDHTTAIHALKSINDALSIPAYRDKLIASINKVIELL